MNKDWWSTVSNPHQWLDLFDSLPNVVFYTKDLKSRFMRVNQASAEFHGCISPEQMVGRRDTDFHTASLAVQYIEEDQIVFASGEPLKGRIWLVPDSQGFPRWFLSSKFPLRNASGAVVGLAGVMYEHAGSAGSAYERLTPALSHVLKHYGQVVQVRILAGMCNLSTSQFQREFQRCFGITPSAYVQGVRMVQARWRLEHTRDPVGTIALEAGFYDQSHFTRTFAKVHGMSPLAFRKRSEAQGSE